MPSAICFGEIVRERRTRHVAYWKEAMRAGKTICHETVNGLVIYLQGSHHAVNALLTGGIICYFFLHEDSVVGTNCLWRIGGSVRGDRTDVARP